MTDSASNGTSCTTPVAFKGKTPMSSALRERLKRSRRSFSSPFRSQSKSCCPSTESQVQNIQETIQEDGSKRLRLTEEHNFEDTNKRALVDSSQNNSPAEGQTTSTGTVTNSSTKDRRFGPAKQCTPYTSVNEEVEDGRTGIKKHGINVLAEKQRLRDVIEQKEESIRRLKLVKTHQEKGDLSKLQVLTGRWKQVSQQVLLQLQERAPADQRPTLGQLMDHMGIDENMLELDREQDCFN